MFRNELFAGQTIIVTGGGSGIGRCTAHELARLGAHTVLIGRKLDKLERVMAEIIDDGGQASCLAQDIRDEAGVRETIEAVLADRGAIHGLINNAGGQYMAPLETINQKGFETVVRTNLTGGFLMAREWFTQYGQKHGGSIVNIVADMWKGMPGMGHSGAARAGMVNFTKTAAVEWARAGVRVNAVAPGWIASSGMATYPEIVRASFPKLVEFSPAKRMGVEAEVSAVICFLLCPAAAFVTGQTWNVDGGAPLMPHHWPMPDHDRSLPYDGFHRSSLPEDLLRVTKLDKVPTSPAQEGEGSGQAPDGQDN